MRLDSIGSPCPGLGGGDGPLSACGSAGRRTDDQRVHLRPGEGLPGRSPARRDGDADEPDPGQHADRDDGRRGALHLRDRPSRPLLAQDRHAGLQDPRADERAGRRERQVLRRDHDARGRRDHGGSERHAAASPSCRRRAASGRSRWRARRSRTSPPTGASCSTTRCWSLGSSPPAPTPATRWATWAASA